MVDRAEIFAALTKRNALRREAGLPGLNLKQEYDFAVSLAVDHESQALSPDHADERLLIEAQVIGELYSTAPDYAQSMAGRRFIQMETRKRFDQFLRNLVSPGAEAPLPRHLVRYGQDN